MLYDLPDNHDIGHLQGALSFVQGRGRAVDVGAHRGIWTRRLCDLFADVIAFEPTERYKLVDPRAKTYQAAIGAAYGRVMMVEGTENTGQAHVAPGDMVSLFPLDHFEIDAVDFIKFDVEGMELPAIVGALDTIERSRPVILLEENGLCARYGIEAGAAGAYLEGLGYEHVARYNKDHVYRWR